jgi:hypothetical protein
MKLFFLRIFIVLPFVIAIPSPIVAQQTTNGYCSPAIEKVTGNVVTNCYVTVADFKKGVTDNLHDAILAVRELLRRQQYYMFPSLDDYLAQPTKENWGAAKDEIDLVQLQITLAVNAVLQYDASLEQELGSDLGDLHGALRNRSGLISRLPTNAPSEDYLRDWIAKYRVQVTRLGTQLSMLEARFKSATFRPSKSVF